MGEEVRIKDIFLYYEPECVDQNRLRQIAINLKDRTCLDYLINAISMRKSKSTELHKSLALHWCVYQIKLILAQQSRGNDI